jgi:hypothetical protein
VNTDRTLSATFWAMVGLQTIGAVDPLQGPRKMPSPRAYVAVVVLWTILHMLAEGSAKLARPAAALSVLTVIAATVIGPAGKTLVSFLNTVGGTFNLAPASTGAPGGASLQGGSAATSSGGVTV